MKENLLQFSAWKIEQNEWAPEAESEIQKQLALSNGYISQYGYAEEHYSAENSAEENLRGITSPLSAGNILSVRLHEERLDLHNWTVEKFYRCLHRHEPKLERSFTAVSPTGNKLEVRSCRQLLTENPHAIDIEYIVRSVNYSGPISFLPLLGDPAAEEYWYPMLSEVDGEYAAISLQSRSENVQIAVAMSYRLLKNGQPSTAKQIRIEKRYVVGYSVTDQIAPGDEFTLCIRKYVTDSRNFPLHNLFEDAIASISAYE